MCALADEESSKPDLAGALDCLRSTQNPDGGWGDTEKSKSNLAATLLVLSANAMVSKASKIEPLASDSVEKARAYVESLGGAGEGLRRVYGTDLTFQVPIRLTSAYAGLLDWNEVDSLPFELSLAPRGLMGVLGLPVVSYAIPALVCMGLASHARTPSWFPPLRWLRSFCADRALDLCLRMQPASGGYLEAIPITAFCLLALKAAGRGEHKVAENARRFLLETQRDDGSWPVEVNLTVWNTTRAVEALAVGDGLGGSFNEQTLVAVRRWLLTQQARVEHPYTGTKPGGWGWNHLSGSVPDADDTSGAILALQHLGLQSEDPALEAGRAWLLGLQNRDGGWPTFCRGWQRLPFDRSAPDLTAHALRALQSGGSPQADGGRRDLAVQKGWRYLRNVQRADGSFAPLWFGCETASDELNATYGTTHVLFACRPEDAETQEMREGALRWLRSVQNLDGGFGGCADAPSTAEETGLALRAMAMHGGSLDDDDCRRAATWLIENQSSEGSWSTAPIGFYFAVLWYHEQMYPLTYALGGLGSLARAGRGRTEAARYREEERPHAELLR